MTSTARTQIALQPTTTLLTREDLAREEALEIELQNRLYEVSLYEYTKAIWHIIEPENPYMDNWHIRAICEHLEYVTTFDIPRLLINMPPRMMKSIIVSVAWPSWVWLKKADRRFLYASYAQTLSTRDSVKMRQVIKSPFYQRLIKGKWTLKLDQDQKMRYDTSESGFRFATSVGGMVTGEGGDYLCIDDPHHALEVHSTKMRETVLDWYDKVFSTRANNPKRVGRVVVMQRLHEKDLSGHLLEKGNWEHLVLPMRYSKKIVSNTRLGFDDPRIQPGDLLFPERFGVKEVKDLEKDLGESARAQLDQDPVPDSGGTFKREWWKWYKIAPKDIVGVYQFIDCASKPGVSNDYSVCATWLETLSGYYILNVTRGKFEWDDLEKFVINQAARWRPHHIVIEDKSSGIPLIQSLKRKTVLPISAYNPTISKELRAISATPQVKAGNVYLPIGAPWVEDFIKEHESFPNSENDDMVDTTSMALAHFHERITIEPRITSL